MENLHTEQIMTTGSISRESFIQKTYTYLILSIVAFIGLEYFFWVSGISGLLLQIVAQTNWLLILGGFILLSWLAANLTTRSTSPASQHLGLIFYVLLEAVIFAPLIALALLKSNDGQILLHAGTLTAIMVFALTGIAFTSGKNFSFLGSFLKIVGIIALGLIVSGVLFGFTLGVWFSGAMVLFASGAILYETSNIIHNYREDQHVMAALSLFASIALLFWYILRFFLNRN